MRRLAQMVGGVLLAGSTSGCIALVSGPTSCSKQSDCGAGATCDTVNGLCIPLASTAASGSGATVGSAASTASGTGGVSAGASGATHGSASTTSNPTSTGPSGSLSSSTGAGGSSTSTSGGQSSGSSGSSAPPGSSGSSASPGSSGSSASAGSSSSSGTGVSSSSGSSAGPTGSTSGNTWNPIPLPMVLENGIAWPLESVASIWMDTVTSGVVAASDTMGGGGSGFLLPITGGQVPSVDGGIATPLFSGYDLMADAGAAVSLHALMEAGSAGLVALNSGGYLLSRASSTANWTFGFTNLGTNHGSPVGTLTDEWWLGQDNAGLWIAFDNGGDLTTVTGTVNKTTTWDNVVWLDQQTESIPDGGVLCGYDSWSATGTYSPFIWVSADGSKMAFPDVQSAGFGGACISTNAGRDFVSIPMTQADAGGIMATGSDFLATGSGSAILVINPNPDPGTTPSPAAYLSTNGGATWLTATLSVATDGGNVAPDSASQLTAAFYASDGMHAWIVGNSGSGLPFLLTSANGGASFANLSPTLAEQYPTSTFTTGFALDQNNIWLGGTIDSSSQQVGLLYSPTGGQ